MKTYTIAKNYANLYLKNKSGLTYTIIHPSTLNDDPGQGSIEVVDTHSTKLAMEKSTSRQDVAAVVANLLLSDGYQNQEIQIVAGDTDIREALEEVK
ncbi:NAD(P)H-binding protein [Anaerococcus sp.]|uniref:NAD(P)H-binding protein n=1 Tax=Anaerococcus sp. TaxID=1872515 RepID=UPI0028FFA35D|nr:NAD(P)H-binding protein [Anaerococcus sp.]MDU1829128.1 NAD(P)H-binding protein [Anaerococcus sp.]MDU1864311.1 NAD(P)H-binding protein [Anaerococcus sp.]